jgi:wyosine [tRNA(Phe)-imidazoG37] synthetase (radical SAM superfamily)
VVLELFEPHLTIIAQDALNALKVNISLKLAVLPALIVSPVNIKTKKVKVHAEIVMKANIREVQVKVSARPSKKGTSLIKQELQKVKSQKETC